MWDIALIYSTEEVFIPSLPLLYDQRDVRSMANVRMVP